MGCSEVQDGRSGSEQIRDSSFGGDFQTAIDENGS